MKKILLSIAVMTISLNAGGSLYESRSGCHYECDPKNESTAEHYDRLGKEYHARRDYGNAILLHYKACTMHYAPGCNHAGYMYDQGEGVKQDHRIARKYFSLACKYRSGIGCSNLGVIYEKGQKVDQSDKKALYYYKRSCDLDTEEGCINYHLLERYMLIAK